MSAEKKSYFNELAKKGYLLIALLITTLAMTAFVASYDYGIFGTIMKHPKVFGFGFGNRSRFCRYDGFISFNQP